MVERNLTSWSRWSDVRNRTVVGRGEIHLGCDEADTYAWGTGKFNPSHRKSKHKPSKLTEYIEPNLRWNVWVQTWMYVQYVWLGDENWENQQIQPIHKRTFFCFTMNDSVFWSFDHLKQTEPRAPSESSPYTVNSTCRTWREEDVQCVMEEEGLNENVEAIMIPCTNDGLTWQSSNSQIRLPVVLASGVLDKVERMFSLLNICPVAELIINLAQLCTWQLTTPTWN